MELLLDKEPVFLTETVYDGQTEQGIELDYILPDYYPDIFKILKCSLTPCVVSYNVSGTQLYIDGVVYIRVLYLAENSSDINCIEQRYTYSKTVEITKETTMPRVSIMPKTDYCTCRAVSGRRIDIRGAVSTKIKVTGCFESALLCGAEGMGAQVSKRSLCYCGSRLYTSRQYVIREDIETGAGKGITSVLSSSCVSTVSDTKIIADKVVVKGEAKIKALYLTRNSGMGAKPEIMEAVIPLSQIIDLDGITDSHSCYAELCVMDCDLEVKQSDDGENRVFGCSITVDCKVGAYKESVISPISDLYSTEYDTCYSVVPMKIEHTPQILSAQCTVRSELECGDGDIAEIFDCKCDIISTSVRRSESGRPVVSGQISVAVIGKNGDGKPVIMEKTESYEAEQDITVDCDGFSFDPLVFISGASYSIAGEGIAEVRVQISTGGLLYRIETVSAVSEITVNEDKPKSRDTDYALKLYYAETGECVWDIAKRYNTSADAITTENELQSDTVTTPCMLLIPII